VRPPPWFHAYCLTGLGSKQAQELLIEGLNVVSDQHGGLHSALLDGVADLVADVNDPAESNDFIAKLHGLAIHYICPFINAIHFNPGSEKSRGHLGSQLERKAETNLTLEKDSSEVTVIFSTKNRRASILKPIGPRFIWSNEHQMHVSVESEATAKIEVERRELADLAESVFADRPAMRRTELETTFKTRLKVGESSAYRKAHRMIELGIIEKTVAGLYVIPCAAQTK
jgi:hypothetical protein